VTVTISIVPGSDFDTCALATAANAVSSMAAPYVFTLFIVSSSDEIDRDRGLQYEGLRAIARAGANH